MNCRAGGREIVEFQLRLDQVTRQAFHWDLVAAAERIFGGRCSDDDFDYFGLWMVGLGGEIFERAVLDPDAWPMLSCWHPGPQTPMSVVGGTLRP
ncbi:DUF4240 domain-containing protein [Streptomyces sp. NBC_00035]|uniref:DUF4240 domain-containing protein n=1 Tax=Streptomyces sp. NBC_00035 TaxID=2903614 RepID=UPI00325475ED